MKTTPSLLALLVLSLPALAAGQNAEWVAYPSVHTVRNLVRVDQDLWGATNGGLFRFDLSTETFQTFTTSDGLSSNDIRALVLDGRGNLILGMGNAYVDVFHLATGQVTRIPDFKQNSQIFQVFALYQHQGEVFVATDVGVSRLAYYPDLGKYLVQGTYSKLGSFQEDVAVNALAVHDGGLWAGTDIGLARGDLSQAYLESPTAWENYTVNQGLSANKVSALGVFRDTLYVGVTGTGSAYLGLNRMTATGFEPLPIEGLVNIALLKEHQDTLYVGRGGGMYRLNDDQLGVTRLGSVVARGLSLEPAPDGTLWAGFQEESPRHGGLRHWAGGTWSFYSPEGLLAEAITDIIVEQDGSLWVTGQKAGSSSGVLSHFDGEHWINLSRPDDYPGSPGGAVSSDSFFWAMPKAMTRDLEGNLWVGSDGRGVGWFHYDEEMDTVLAHAYYSAASGRLFGITATGAGANYVVVRDLMTDDQGNVWIGNAEVVTTVSDPIAVVPADFIQDTVAFPNWTYTTIEQFGSPIQFSAFHVDRLGLDTFGHKWFGGTNNNSTGLWVLDDNGTPLNTGDDSWAHLPNLPSDSITAITTDREGLVWVGTPSGVQYFYPQEDVSNLAGVDLYIPLGQNVNCITVDPQNNKWFGTTNGVAVLGADNFTWLQFYTDLEGFYPTPMPSSSVQAIAFDAKNGYAYLGTGAGLARVKTPYKGMGEAVTSVTLWPNPLHLSEGTTERMQLDPMGLNETTELKIFTASGLLVRHLGLTELNMGWDGRNMKGELVGSGVYLVLAYSSDGSAQVGKVAVIRQ
ncbi:MAG: hypothetical protein C4524_10825 [Candidatus Zixiibacteriota bacterium]|nr:MAG: hypothetical protein C4524_10825 [candidate division Zixibacteria bacterium]